MRYVARIIITLRPSILDPQGKATLQGLRELGYREVQQLRIGKFIEMHVEASSEEVAREIVKDACDRLLANPVMEDYTFELEPVALVPDVS